MAGASKDIGKLVVQLQMEMEGLRADVAKSNKLIKSASQGWVADIKSASRGIAEVFAGSFLSGALQQGISAITSGIEAMFDKLDNLADSADKLNTTTETLQAIGFAASQTGVDLGDAEKALAKLQINLGQIGTGAGKKAADAIKQLGLSANQLRSMEAGDALATIGTALQGLPDQTSRMAAAVALLGKGATELLPLVTQFAELRDKAISLGVIIDERTVRAAADFVDQTEILKIQGTALLAEFLRPLIPVLMQTAQEMGGVADSAKQAGSGMAGAKSDAAELGKAFADLIRWGNAADETLTNIYRAFQENGRRTRELLQHGNAALAGGSSDAELHAFREKQKAAQDAAAAQKAQAEFAARWEQETLARLARERTAREAAARAQAEGEEANKKAAAQAAAEAAARDRAAEAAKRQKDAEEALRREREQTQKLLADALANEDALRASRDQSIRNIEDAQARVMGSTQDQIDLQRAANDSYSQEIVLNNQRAKSMTTLADELDQWARFAKDAFDAQTGGAISAKAAVDNLTAAYNTGRISLDEYNAGVKQISDQQNKLTQEQQQYAETLGTGFGEIFGAVITGAEDAEEAVKRLIIQLAALALQQAAMRGINAMFGTANAKGNAFGPNGLEAFAQGGVVMGPTRFSFAGGRRMGVMGEAGPEGVLPLARGANGKLGVQAVGGGGMNVTVINNVGAQVTTSQDDPSNMRITIDQMSNALAAQISRGGNQVSAAIERAYGVRR